MNAARRIVVRGVNWLGDAVMALPALQRLREAYPQAHIALVTPQKLNELWTDSPFISDTFAFAEGESVWSISRRLREEHYDLGLILPNSPRSAIELWLGRVPRRIGYRRPWRNLFLTQAVADDIDTVIMKKRGAAEIRRLITSGQAPSTPPPDRAHHLFHYLHLAAAVGASALPVAPSIPIAGAEIRNVREAFHIPMDSAAMPVFGLNPGAEYGSAKRWPAEHFVAAAREVQSRTGCLWVLFGGPGDVALAGEIERSLASNASRRKGARVVNLAGRTTLRQLCAALRACRVVLTNDTGHMHLAAAVGTRVVALFGSTSPELTGPGLPGDPRHHLMRTDVPCRPCFRRDCPIDLRCLRGLTPAAVVEQLLSGLP